MDRSGHGLILTTTVHVAEVGEAPDVAQPHGVPSQREDVVLVRRPVAPLLVLVSLPHGASWRGREERRGNSLELL